MVKKKFLTQTYLKGVTNYEINIQKEEKYNCYTVIKYIKNIQQPYLTTHNTVPICLLDDNFYMIEYLPMNQKYIVRVFLNQEKIPLQYYIDITKENGWEEGIPYYEDLFLDITIDKCDNGLVTVWDKEELEEALKNKEITKQDYEEAYKILNKILEQISTNSNIYINRNHKEVIESNLEKHV